MNYKEIVNNTVIPGTLSNAEKEVRYTQLGKHITSLFPKRLYRYRCCSERHLSAFYKDELWFSNGSAMNDDFDARLYYNRKVIQERLRDLRLENRGKDFISTVIDIDKLPSDMKFYWDLHSFPYAFFVNQNIPSESINGYEIGELSHFDVVRAKMETNNQ